MTVTGGSLRLRLLVAGALSIIAALGLAYLALTTLFERHVERRVERELDNHLRQIAAMIEPTPEGKFAVAGALADPRFERPFSGLYWQIEEDGKVIDASPSLGDETLKVPAPQAGTTKPVCVDVPGPRGKTLALVARDLTIRIGDTDHALRTAAAIDHSEIEDAVREFGRDIAQSLAILGACLIAAAGLQVSVGLRPLEVVRRRLVEVREGTHARLTGAFPGEVAPLVDDLNGLLDAQEKSIQRARARASDLAHGLKTPLTILNSAAHELTQRGQSPIAQTIAEQISSMQHHIERQLAQANIAATSQPQYSNVADVAGKIIATMQRLPRGTDLRWQLNVAEGSRIPVEADDLAEILGTLLENACRWSKSVVRLSGEPTAPNEPTLRALTIEDDGGGVAEEHWDNILKRGGRLDTSQRSSGLGLAIAKDICEAYGGTLSLFQSNLGGLGVRIRLA